MTIPIKSNNKQIIKDYVSLISTIFKLTKNEIKVMSGIVTLYYANRTTTKQDIYRFIMSHKARKGIRKSIDMSEACFNNAITSMRKKNAIKGERIHPIFTLLKVNNNVAEIIFKITLHANE